MNSIYKHLIALLLITLLTPTLATAKTIGLSISPPVTEVLLSPNKSLRTSLTLTNNTNSDTSYLLSLHSIIPTGTDGHSTINPKPLDLTTIPLTIRPVGLELGQPIPIKSGETQVVSLELEAANLEEPQDVYFAVLARPINDNASPTITTTSPGIAALIMSTITPIPSLPTNIALENPNMPLAHDNTLPLNLNLVAENKTNIMLQVQLKAKLVSPNRDIIHESVLEPKLVLGNNKRQFNLPSINTQISQLGPHTLTIELATLGGRVLTEHSYIIWLLPLRYIFISMATLILLTIPFLRKILLTNRVKKA